jgi:hypothetical protein
MLYLIQTKIVNLNKRIGEEKRRVALHDVPETKGVSVWSQNVSALYLIQTKVVGLNRGGRAGRKTMALHDIIETKEVSDERRKPSKNLCY